MTAAEWQEVFGERAAIAEYLGGVPRAAAEQLAREIAGPCPNVPGASSARERRYDGEVDPNATRISRWAGERAEPDDPREDVGSYTSRAQVETGHAKVGVQRATSTPTSSTAPRDAPGPSRCRSCRKPIVFAGTAAGKVAPFEIDVDGEWTIENNVARQVGPAPAQLELGATRAIGPDRYTSHFATCPAADQWRKRATKERR